MSTHTHQAHADKWETLPDNSNIDSTVNSTQKGSAAVSAKIMDAYLANGTKPMFPMREGFLCHFVAWVIEDDLPWTTGETPGIIRLFHFAEVRWELPSDTTVQKMVAKFFVELHSNLVKELTVSENIHLHLSINDDDTLLHRQWNQRLLTQLTIGQPNRWFLHLQEQWRRSLMMSGRFASVWLIFTILKTRSMREYICCKGIHQNSCESWGFT